MKVTDNKGYSLVELLVVIIIATAIIVVISNSLLNNLRLSNRYSKLPMPFYSILKINNMLGKDLQNCTRFKMDDDGNIFLEVPIKVDDKNFKLSKIKYTFLENELIRERNDIKQSIPLNDMDVLVYHRFKIYGTEFQVKYSTTTASLYTAYIRNYNINGVTFSEKTWK